MRKSSILLFLLLNHFCLAEEPATNKPRFTSLTPDKTFTGWKLISKKQEPGLPERIFQVTPDGLIHIYNNFPDGYQLDEGKNETHALMITEKSYSCFHFKWDYKWGKKRLNNFGKYQWDAGMFYHMQSQRIWPQAYEYQIRFHHLDNQNHTGNVWNCGVDFQWTRSESGHYLPLSQGGKNGPALGGNHPGKPDAKFHALDDQWNHCEVIVMANDYAIHKLNGQVVNVITNLAHDSGPISLQAETAEIFYRNLQIKEFPAPLPITRFIDKKDL